MKKQYDSLLGTDATFYETYWESELEFRQWSNRILKTFKELEAKGYTEVGLMLDPYISSEYGDNFAELEIRFEYLRDKTEEEIKADELKVREAKFKEEAHLQLLRYDIDSDTYHSILGSKVLTEMFLDDKLDLPLKEV